MTNITNDEALRRVDLASGLDDGDVQKLAKLVSQYEFPPATTIFREGNQHETLYWVVDGIVTLQMCGSHAGAKSVLTVGRGELLAWSAFVGNRRMTATATTSTHVLLIGFDSTELRQICEQDHDIGYRLMRTLAESLAKRLVATRLQLLDLFQHPAENM